MDELPITEATTADLIGKTEDEIMDMFDCSQEGIDATCESVSADEYADRFMRWIKERGIKIVRI